MHKIRIETEGSVGRIVIDGKDVSEMVTGAQLTLKAGKLPELHLTVVGDIELDVDGSVGAEADSYYAPFGLKIDDRGFGEA